MARKILHDLSPRVETGNPDPQLQPPDVYLLRPSDREDAVCGDDYSLCITQEDGVDWYIPWSVIQELSHVVGQHRLAVANEEAQP